ncbi:MAG: hydroxyacid dehydrogenase, partial [Dinghuibacter sp.]|nr:hydroxyacid dehydrogenase [Dinghuibacter sp.]
MQQVMITARAHECLADELIKRNYRVHYMPDITYDELYHRAEEFTGLVVTTR